MLLKLEIEHLEELLNIMKSCGPFNRIYASESSKEVSGNQSIADYVRSQINEHSSEELFRWQKNQALKEAYWQKGYVPPHSQR